MARGDDLQAIKYLPLKLKGPARHWLNSLPENSIGSWEDLEDAFHDNFQGTYVRPPDADDLGHIVQQPGESARKLWTRFLVKKNQIVDCPDAEALAAFKHSVRDEWLARHLGQEKPKSMSALTSLMTRFCAGEDSCLLVEATTPAIRALPRSEMAMANLDAANTNVAMTTKERATQQSTPASATPNLSGLVFQ